MSAPLPQWTSEAGPRQTKAVDKALRDLRFRGCFHVSITDHGRNEVMRFGAPPSEECDTALRSIWAKYNGTITRGNYSAIVADADAARVALVLPEIDERPTDEERQERARACAEMQEREDARRNAIAESRARLSPKIPRWADALIVAELDENDSDPMSDYHNRKTDRRVLIGFRRGKREDFRQLRAAAGRFPETAHLGLECDRFRVYVQLDVDLPRSNGGALWKGCRSPWHSELYQGENAGHDGLRFTTQTEVDSFLSTAPAPHPISDDGTLATFSWHVERESIEHRENYSMGAGNYIKAGHDDSTGWRIRSRDLSALDSEAYEDGLPTTTEPTEDAAPIQATGYRIEKHHHTKRGFDFHLVVMADRVERDEFDRLRRSCENAGGWYSRAWAGTPGGFAFREQSLAQGWAERVFSGQPTEDHAPDVDLLYENDCAARCGV